MKLVHSLFFIAIAWNAYGNELKIKAIEQVCGQFRLSLNSNAVDKVEQLKFYYIRYKQLIKSNGDFGKKLTNPYPIIALQTRDKSVKDVLKVVNDWWPINGNEAIACEKRVQTNKDIIISKINPLGYSVLWGNEEMLKALLELGADCFACAKSEPYNNLITNKYNAFEYAIYDDRPNLADIIYNHNPSIVSVGNPLKIALIRAIQNKSADHSLFILIHNLIYKYKNTFDHSLLKIAAVDYADVPMTKTLLQLGYKPNILLSESYLPFFDYTTADHVVALFEKVGKSDSADAERVGKIVVEFFNINGFNDKQEAVLTKLINERIIMKSATSHDLSEKNSKEYTSAMIVNNEQNFLLRNSQDDL